VPTVAYNPGEPVFDQTTGEPYIDDDGNLVEVAPGLRVDTSDGRTLDGDDVANAAWWHANLREGEVLRDQSIGVPYERQALGQQDPGLAMTVVLGEVRRRTPGVVGIVEQRVVIFEQRVLRFQATLLRADGSSQATKTTVT
jgi:hypothetical protein